jgi:hypothetical protein
LTSSVRECSGTARKTWDTSRPRYNCGDYSSVSDLDKLAEKLKPYDEDWYRWDNIPRELTRIGSPIRMFQGPVNPPAQGKAPQECPYGCVMAVKMTCATIELYAGTEAFRKARPLTMIIGNPSPEPIDCNGGPVMVIGSCSQVKLKNHGKVTRISKCFSTASDMMLQFGLSAGIPTMFTDVRILPGFIKAILGSAAVKLFGGRYIDDVGYFLKNWLVKKI